MLTESKALNHYAQPHVTHDIDVMVAPLLSDLRVLPTICGGEFYFRAKAARVAVMGHSRFIIIRRTRQAGVGPGQAAFDLPERLVENEIDGSVSP